MCLIRGVEIYVVHGCSTTYSIAYLHCSLPGLGDQCIEHFFAVRQEIQGSYLDRFSPFLF